MTTPIPKTTPESTKEAPRELFDVWYLDPPWKPGQQGGRGASQHYELMTTDEIKGLAPAIAAHCAESAVMFLWVTANTVPDGLECLKAFGFRYITNMVWAKDQLGLGNIVRGTHELLLIGVKGRPPKVAFHSQRSVLFMPRTIHSAKPVEMVHVIERLYPTGNYIELFARTRPNSRRPWAIHGLEVDSDISFLEWGYPVPSDFARQGTDGERTL